MKSEMGLEMIVGFKHNPPSVQECKECKEWVSTLPQVDLTKVLNPWNKSANRTTCPNWALFITLKVQILKMDSHFPFGNLKLKLWPKEWFAITQTWTMRSNDVQLEHALWNWIFFSRTITFPLKAFQFEFVCKSYEPTMLQRKIKNFWDFHLES